MPTDELRPRISLGSASQMIVSQPIMRGRFRLTKGRGDEIIWQSPWFDNLITDYGRNGLADTLMSALTTYCHVGTGTAIAAASDTGLASFFAATSTVTWSSNTVSGDAPHYAKYIRNFRLPAGTFDGHTMTEVALSDQATDGHAFSRALIEDPTGQFTAVKYYDDEWCDVTYEFRLYPDHINADGTPNDGTGTLTIEGSDYTYTIRPCFVTNVVYWDGSETRAQFREAGSDYAAFFGSASVLGAVTGEPTSPSGTDVTNANHVMAATYVTDTFTRAIYLAVAPTVGNATGGIGAMRINTGFGTYQIAFDPVIPKDSSMAFQLAVNLAWDNAEF